MSATAVETVWLRGRFDARSGPGKLLFGFTYEDAAIEIGAFRPGGRVLCIAAAGDTAMRLASHHQVVAVDVNPAQLAYARRRCAGGPGARGSAERWMGFVRTFAPLTGWTRARLERFLALDDPAEQTAYWRRCLDTRRFRRAFDGVLSARFLGAIYAPELLSALPPRSGAVLRARLERGFGRHPNRENPYARALLLGEPYWQAASRQARSVRFVHADAASFLEGEPAGSFQGFALSNVLDGASPEYGQRLLRAVERAAAPGAVMVLRSFREPPGAPAPTNRAAEDRAMLWGVVEVREVAAP